MLLKYIHLLRLHKPIPILLLLAPVYMGLILAHQGQLDFKITLIFTLGGIIMRTAGCVANDISDTQIDSHVTRTKTRPLARGDLTQKQALLILLGLLGCALGLVLFLNAQSFSLALIALGLSFFYPLTKRFFILPQLVLGITYNFGVLMAFTALESPLTDTAFLLYISSIFWTLAYDTFYALCDKEDDQKLGIHSSALFFGNAVYPAIGLLQTAALCCWVALGVKIHASGLFYLMLGCSALNFFYQYCVSRYRNQHLRAFNLNLWVGFFLLLGTKSVFI